MALPASSMLLLNPKTQIKLFRIQPYQCNRCLHSRFDTVSFMKTTNAQFGEWNKFKLQFNNVKEKLWDATPTPVKEFPWKEASDMMLKQLLVMGKKGLKWSFIVFFCLSSTSDVIFSISENQELMIPIGLLIGCLMTDFLKETLHEFFRALEERELNLPLVIISCFFIFVKMVSSYFTTRPQVLLLHVANGGLMQALWLWRQKRPPKQNDENNVSNFITAVSDK